MIDRVRKVSIAILCVCVVGIVFFSVSIAINLIDDRQGTAFYASLPTPIVDPQTGKPRSGAAAGDGESPESGADNAEVVIGDSWKPALDFDTYSQDFPGIVAWIRIDGTTVDYPVMQGADNDYYLTRLPNGKKSARGSLFVNCGNSPDFSDPNTIIYGHNMKSGSMFGSLKKYRNKGYYEDHPTVLIFTPKRDYVVELFAGYIIRPSEETPPTQFRNDRVFNSYVKAIRERSIFKSDVVVNAGDRLVSLCTCTYEVNDGRLILVGKLT